MRVLIIEDNDVVYAAMADALNSRKCSTVRVKTVEDVYSELAHGRFDAVILDTAVDNGNGLEVLNGVALSDNAKKKTRILQAEKAGIIIISHIGETIPRDNILIKKEIKFPFTTKELITAVEEVQLEREENKSSRWAFFSRSMPDQAADLDKRGIVENGAYLFDQSNSKLMKTVPNAFASMGYDMYLITASRPKVAKERAGLDRNVDVLILNGTDFRLGSMVESVDDFVSKKEKPVVIIDNLENIINHCGFDRTLRALSALLRKEEGRNFTFITSYDGRIASDSFKGMLGELMTIYQPEE